MKVGDLVRVKNIYDHMCVTEESQDTFQSGFLLCITEISPDGYYVMVMEGRYLGAEHWITGENLEVISECR